MIVALQVIAALVALVCLAVVSPWLAASAVAVVSVIALEGRS